MRITLAKTLSGSIVFTDADYEPDVRITTTDDFDDTPTDVVKLIGLPKKERKEVNNDEQ